MGKPKNIFTSALIVNHSGSPLPNIADKADKGRQPCRIGSVRVVNETFLSPVAPAAWPPVAPSALSIQVVSTCQFRV